MFYVPSLFLEFQFVSGRKLRAQTFISEQFYKNIQDPKPVPFKLSLSSSHHCIIQPTVWLVTKVNCKPGTNTVAFYSQEPCEQVFKLQNGDLHEKTSIKNFVSKS